VPPGFRIPGTETLKVGHYGVKLQFDTHQTPVESVIAELAQSGTVVDVTISDPSLEQVIRVIYGEAKG
jgi:ABC-type uncharacterized transport system ATPase subunit